jgi:hypothetical protein
MDSRAYVCKCINGTFAFIALNNTDMGDNDVSTRVVETWTFGKSQKAQLCEIVYSKKRASQYIRDFDGSVMYGPDLFNVDVDGKVEINLWQPMHMPESVELEEINEEAKHSTSLFAMNPVNPAIPVLLRKTMLLSLEKKYGPVKTLSNPEATSLALYL